jgi:hypothetical protein
LQPLNIQLDEFNVKRKKKKGLCLPNSLLGWFPKTHQLPLSGGGDKDSKTETIPINPHPESKGGRAELLPTRRQRDTEILISNCPSCTSKKLEHPLKNTLLPRNKMV